MQTQESLASQLASYKVGFIGRAPAPRVAMMEAATAQFKSTGIESIALKVGDRAASTACRMQRANRSAWTSCWNKDLWWRSSIAAVGDDWKLRHRYECHCLRSVAILKNNFLEP
jgi:hypothetical protein